MFSSVHVHDSLSAAAWAAALEESLRRRDLAPRFLYESPKQARRWMALHERYSPARRDAEGAAIYERASAQAAARLRPGPATVIGLGCGGGQKEAALLRQVRQAGHPAAYVPVDASLPLVLAAAATARAAAPGLDCQPVAADLTAAAGLPDLLSRIVPPDHARVFAFYGMLPNLEPDFVRAWLGVLIRPGDQVLLSANLAPGSDYAAGVRQILPQYDNPLMREWLLTWPQHLGLDPDAFELGFGIASHAGPPDLLRVEAHLRFLRPQQIGVEGANHAFAAGDSMRVFFSYRHTAERVHELLRPAGLRVTGEWVTPSGEEGVFAASAGSV